MKITIESTDRIVQLHNSYGEYSVPARVWVGETESGVPVHCYVTRISPQTNDAEAVAIFEKELIERAPPLADVEAIPMRMRMIL